VCAVDKEGICRKSKGFLFSQFAHEHCMGKEEIMKAHGGPVEKRLPLEKTTMVKVEWIYCALLTVDNPLAFSPNAMKQIHKRVAAKDIMEGIFFK